MEEEKFWVGVAFAAGLVILLGIAIFYPLQKQANNILRLLGAICAGASAVFMTGGSLIEIRGETDSGLSTLIQATGGFVLFWIVWRQWGERLPPATVVRTAPQGTLQQTAETIANLEGATVQFRNFDARQLAAPVGDHVLRGRTLLDVLKALRRAAHGTDIPDFQVTEDDHNFTLTAEGERHA